MCRGVYRSGFCDKHTYVPMVGFYPGMLTVQSGVLPLDRSNECVM